MFVATTFVFPVSLTCIDVIWRVFKRLRTPYFQPSVARLDSGKSEQTLNIIMFEIFLTFFCNYITECKLCFTSNSSLRETFFIFYSMTHSISKKKMNLSPLLRLKNVWLSNYKEPLSLCNKI